MFYSNKRFNKHGIQFLDMITPEFTRVTSDFNDYDFSKIKFPAMFSREEVKITEKWQFETFYWFLFVNKVNMDFGETEYIMFRPIFFDWRDVYIILDNNPETGIIAKVEYGKRRKKWKYSFCRDVIKERNW